MYTLRIPGYIGGLTSSEELTGSKEEIARKLLMPNPERDIHGVKKLPKDADCILEQTETITKGRVHRTEVNQVGRWTVGQLLSQGLLTDLF